MADLQKQMWQQMNTNERKALLKKFFFTVVFTRDDCPEFMDEKDYEVMQKNVLLYNGFYREEEFSIILDCEFFAYYHGWKHCCPKQMKIVTDFFESHIEQRSIGEELPVLGKVAEQNMLVYIDFNPPAFFQWLATHDLATF